MQKEPFLKDEKEKNSIRRSLDVSKAFGFQIYTIRSGIHWIQKRNEPVDSESEFPEFFGSAEWNLLFYRAESVDDAHRVRASNFESGLKVN